MKKVITLLPFSLFDVTNNYFGVSGREIVDNNNDSYGSGHEFVDNNNDSYGFGRELVDNNNYSYGSGHELVDNLALGGFAKISNYHFRCDPLVFSGFGRLCKDSKKSYWVFLWLGARIRRQ